MYSVINQDDNKMVYDNALGRLMVKDGKNIVYYHPFEVSSRGLGILSERRLQKGTDLILESKAGNIKLTVTDARKGGDSNVRYKLTLTDRSINMDKILSVDNSLKMRSDREVFPLQCARFNLRTSLDFKTRTFGSPSNYIMEVINASRTGLLVSPPKAVSSRVPFMVNTLLECRLGGGEVVDSILTPLAKVVRLFEGDGLAGQRQQFFGLQFLEFSASQQELWNEALESVESKQK